ncbi:MAG: hypothetical protein K2X27_09300, partial [Candidatus Obscuribacterales bacterium]|nr:hypothetical protein [Candidatus Obscuribacterales bacterium]
MDAFLGEISFSLGERSFSLEESNRAGRLLSSVQALREAGFNRHCIAGETQSSYDLAKLCVQKLNCDLSKIGAIVYSTCLPQNANMGDTELFHSSRDVKHLMDFPGSHLQSEFGMEKAFVMGISQQACTGLLAALNLGKLLLADDPYIDSILCLTADRFPQGAIYEQAYNLISDGAAAAIVSRNPAQYKIRAWHAITNGGLAQAGDEEAAGTYFVYCNRLIRETLNKAGLSMEQISWIVPQNRNMKAWQILTRLLKFDDARTFAGSRPE